MEENLFSATTSPFLGPEGARRRRIMPASNVQAAFRHLVQTLEKFRRRGVAWAGRDVLIETSRGGLCIWIVICGHPLGGIRQEKKQICGQTERRL